MDSYVSVLPLTSRFCAPRPVSLPTILITSSVANVSKQFIGMKFGARDPLY